jgi:hypothetical protein
VELRLPGLRQDVEAEAEVGLVGEAIHRDRVAVNRELERGLAWRSEYFRAAVLRSTPRGRPRGHARRGRGCRSDRGPGRRRWPGRRAARRRPTRRG